MRARIRKFAIVEPLAVFAFIMAYIWDLRYRHPLSWLAIVALILLSHTLRGERAAKLGFRSENLGRCVRDYAPTLAFCGLALLGLGVVCQTTRPITLDQCLAAGLLIYLGPAPAVRPEWLLPEPVLACRIPAGRSRNRGRLVRRRSLPELVSDGDRAGGRICVRAHLPALPESLLSRDCARNAGLPAVSGCSGLH